MIGFKILIINIKKKKDRKKYSTCILNKINIKPFVFMKSQGSFLFRVHF